MVQITTGTFGYYNGRKVVPITSADGPQKFDPELEARLVKQGIAKYVDAPAGQTETAGRQHEEPVDTTADLPKYNDRMKLDELKKVASAYGVDASAMTKKGEVIKVIEAAKAATEQTDDGTDEGDDDEHGSGGADEGDNAGSDEDEEPPQPGVADPV
ncbi:transposase [Oscillibacter sp.]|uniref:transposase n=1 Tax=Oscillibacter sp. TaxID=1945593 RepID=UPI00258532CF|nr:transposase [Oscillibacter sp.]